MKKTVKVTAKSKEFLLAAICEGYDLENACRKFPNDLPSVRTITNHMVKDPEFDLEVSRAYTVLYMKRMSELESLSTITTGELCPGLDFREAAEYKKSRIDAIKFLLGKMAPTLSRKFDRISKSEVLHQIEDKRPVIINYYQPDEEEPKLID